MAINIKAPYLASKMVIPHLSSKVSVLLFRSQIALVVANMIVNHKKKPSFKLKKGLFSFRKH
jgi:hypothetical protein